MVTVQAVHEGKIVGKRRKSCTDIDKVSSIQAVLPQFKLNPGPEFYPDDNHASSREAEAPETNSCTGQSSENVSINDNIASLKDGNGYKQKISLKSISVIRRELPETSLGWPLRRRIFPGGQDAFRRSKARSMSLIEWVVSLPTRSSEMVIENPTDSNSDEANIFWDENTDDFISNNEGTNVQAIHSSENDQSLDRSSDREDEESDQMQERLSVSGSFSAVTEESTQLALGWPLHCIKSSAILGSLEESESTFGMSLTNQSAEATPKTQIDLPLPAPRELPMKLELVLKLNSPGCKQFRYKDLEKATHKFSAGNLIGEGGCSNVYKGCLCKCKPVAIKVLKQYKEAWRDFFLEVDIMSSLKHKNITHLIGVCVEDDHLILVYDFLSKGSLEERLQGYEKSILPWKVRFKVAIAVAEALNYLHKGCPHSVIHRDVKSSNILLSSNFHPQLSDFGLATWGPEDAAYKTSSDIVGTFGYIAPEYFTHGRISDKIDIYSFGIVLLELLTGKKPISSKGQKGQEILVMWTMPMLESGNLAALVDSNLGNEVDMVQLHKMALAATLCIKQSPKLRPKASQILKLLRDEKDVRKWMNEYVHDLKQSSYEESDDFFPEHGNKLSSDSSLLVMDDGASYSIYSGDDTSLASLERRHRIKLKDYLKGQQD